MEGEMDRRTFITPLSVRYRRRGAEFARIAEAFQSEGNEEDAMRALQSALSWIQLAENEELLRGATGAVMQR
jgi:hypothetical protein